MDYVGSSLLAVVLGLLAWFVPDGPFDQRLISWEDLEPDVEIVEAADLAGSAPSPKCGCSRCKRTSWTVM